MDGCCCSYPPASCVPADPASTSPTRRRPPAGDLELTAVAPLVAGLGLPFVTADLVRHADGGWRLVEVGNGQVSDRPRSTAAADLVGILGAG